MRARRNVFAFLLGFALVCIAATASAADSCITIRYGPCTSGSACTAMGSHDYVGTAPTAAMLLDHWSHWSSCISGGGGGCYSDWVIAKNQLGSLGTGNGWRMQSTCTTGGSNPGCGKTPVTREGNITNQGAAACPPDPCDAYEGKKATFAQNFPGGLPEMGGNFTMPGTGGCGAQRSAASSCTSTGDGGFFCLVTYTYTGDAPEESPGATEPEGQASSCSTIKGKKNCAIETNETSGQTCGTFNGERLCFPKDPTTDGDGLPPSGGCWSTPGGGLLCASDAEVQDDEGNPVEPDQQVVTATGSASYYSESTVTTSNVTTIITGQGNMGSGEAVESDCEGMDCLTGGEMGGVGEPGAVTSAGMGRIADAPIVAAVAGLSGGLVGGTCPVWQTTVNAGAFGTYEIDFGFICDMWEDIASVISAVCLAGFVLLGVRILMSA